MKKSYILLPLSILLGLSIIFRYSSLDITLEALFYSPATGFFLRYKEPWNLLYKYGTLPGIFLSLGGAIAFIGSFFSPRLRPFKKEGLYLILVMLIGPGLLVNLVFKDHWGRPRPRQVVMFGGNRAYIPLGTKGPPHGGRSFPSGHASSAFYLMTPFFILRRRSKRKAYFFMGLGITYGILMGIARMVQGAHFPSDILWAWGIVYFTALYLAYLFGFMTKSKDMNSCSA